MYDITDAKQILISAPPVDWKRPLGATSYYVDENGSKMTWTHTNSHGLKQST